MAKLILKKCLTIFTVIGLSFGTLVVASGNAGASSSSREGQDGNNLVCGGVHTLAKAKYIARGGSVKCANGTVERGIGKVWAAEGMTLQVIERMKFGTVCSNQGYLSSGREIGPDPSKNVRHNVPGAFSVYSRPYSVWGYECAQWLHGFTESGESVGILTGCGNGLMRYWPPSGPSPVRTVACVLNGTPETSVPVGYTVQNGNCVNIAAQACVVNYGGQWNSVTGVCNVNQGTCDVFIVINGSGNTVNVSSCNTTTTTQPVTTTTLPPTTTTSTTTTTTLPKPPPTTTTTLPTPKPLPPTVQILTQPQEVSISGTDVPGTTPFSADVSAQTGDRLTVVFKAQWGSFPNSSFTYGGGMNQVITTYDAPSELPPASTINGVTANWETVTVTVYDTTSGLTASQSVSFPILPASTTR